MYPCSIARGSSTWGNDDTVTSLLGLEEGFADWLLPLSFFSSGFRPTLGFCQAAAGPEHRAVLGGLQRLNRKREPARSEVPLCMCSICHTLDASLVIAPWGPPLEPLVLTTVLAQSRSEASFVEVLIPPADTLTPLFLQAPEQCMMGTVAVQEEMVASGCSPRFCCTSCPCFDPVNRGDKKKK